MSNEGLEGAPLALRDIPPLSEAASVLQSANRIFGVLFALWVTIAFYPGYFAFGWMEGEGFLTHFRVLCTLIGVWGIPFGYSRLVQPVWVRIRLAGGSGSREEFFQAWFGVLGVAAALGLWNRVEAFESVHDESRRLELILFGGVEFPVLLLSVVYLLTSTRHGLELVERLGFVISPRRLGASHASEGGLFGPLIATSVLVWMCLHAAWHFLT